jgi:hypothetical protein
MWAGPWLILVGCLALGGAFVCAVLWAFVWTPPKEWQLRRLARSLGPAFVTDDKREPGQGVSSAVLRSRTGTTCHVLRGVCEGHRVSIWVYETSWEGRTPRLTTCFVLEEDSSFPDLLVWPRESFWNRTLMSAVDEIRLESLEFSETFSIAAADRKFAYDVLHPRMMEHLLELPGPSLEICRNHVTLGFEKPLPLREIRIRLKQFVEIRKLFPKFLMEGRAEENK